MTWAPQPQKPQSSWRPIRSIRAQLGELLGNQRLILTMLHELVQGQNKIMNTTADIKAAEEAFGEKFAALVTLTNNIFDKLAGSPVSEDPAVQEVLDMIHQHSAAADAALARDTAAPPASEPAPADGSTSPAA